MRTEEDVSQLANVADMNSEVVLDEDARQSELEEAAEKIEMEWSSSTYLVSGISFSASPVSHELSGSPSQQS